MACRVCSRRTSGTPGNSRGTSAPDPTTKRPATMVCHAEVGPQRSQASTGSATAPAYSGPSRRHTAISATAPGTSVPISPRRPRQSAPPLGRHLRARRGRSATRAVPELAEEHRLTGLEPHRAAVGRRRAVDPRPTEIPYRRMGTTGAIPEPRMRLLLGQWATDTSAVARRRCSASLGRTQCATQVRGWPSRCARGTRRPAARRWRPRRRRPRRSRRSGCAGARRAARQSSAVAVMSRSVTLKGLHGAKATRTMAPGSGRGGGRRPPRSRRGSRRHRRPRRPAAARRPGAEAHRPPRGGMEAHPEVAGRDDRGAEEVAGTAGWT